MRVPTYDDPQETLRPLPDVREQPVPMPVRLVDSAAEQGIQTGQALQNAGSDLGKIAVAMQDRQNADMLFRAETGIKNDYLTFENSLRDRRGQNAWGAAQDAAKWWDDQAAAHSENLQNDVQRRLFAQSVAKLRTQSLDTVSAYEAGERRRSLDESANASIVGSINLASANWNNPELIASAKQDIVKRAQVRSQLNGDSPELAAGKLAEYLTNFHSQIIQNRVDTDPVGAREYYEANKAEINGSVQDKLDKVLKLGGYKTVAQQFADEAQQSGMSEADAVAAARKKFEGEQEDYAVLEIKTRFKEQQDAIDLTQKKNADVAWDIFAKTKDINQVPASVMNGLDGKVRLALEKEARDLASGVNVKTDPEHYYELRQMMRSDPAAFARRDLRQDFPYLSQPDREEFIKAQTNPNELKDAATLDQQLSNMHDQLGWGASDRDKKGAFDNAVTKAVNDEQQRLNKKLSFEERQKIIDRMVTDGEVLSGHWYMNDPNKKYYEVAGTEDAARFAPTVPPVERTKIEAALKRAHRPVTDAEVVRLYKLKTGMQ